MSNKSIHHPTTVKLRYSNTQLDQGSVSCKTSFMLLKDMRGTIQPALLLSLNSNHDVCILDKIASSILFNMFL